MHVNVADVLLHRPPHVTLPQNGLGSKTDDGRAMDGREDDVRRTG